MVATNAAANQVPPEDACTRCGERDADRLVWDEDGTEVTCATCGAVYRPGVEGGNHEPR